MEKLIHSSDAQDALLEQAGGALVFLFEDVDQVKLASSSAMSEKLMRDNLPDDRHFGVHLIAMGSEENYGFNRNIDGWPEQSLRDRHHTFVKNGHFFREHRNRDPKLAIGTVKASAYNEKMDRVELIVHGDKEKAVPEWERCRNNKTSSFSMSARVKGDICNCCGHFAKKASEYCSCVKNTPGRWLKEFSKFAYVSNVHPTFFDISDVGYPADRIAHHIEYLLHESDMKKAASAESPVVTSAQRAVDINLHLPEDLSVGASTPYRQQLLTKLATLETRVAALQTTPDSSPLSLFLKHAAAHAFPDFAATDAQLDQLRQVDQPVLFNKLASRGAVLPLHWFTALYAKVPLSQAAEHPITKAAAAHLPNVFRRLATEPSSRELEELMQPASDYKTACWSGDPIDNFLDQLGSAYSVQPARVSVRIICATARPSVVIKSAADQSQHDALGKQLADAYGFYKLGFVEYAEQNLSSEFVDEPALVLLVSTHKT